jgi:hypothetical protein
MCTIDGALGIWGPWAVAPDANTTGPVGESHSLTYEQTAEHIKLWLSITHKSENNLSLTFF